MSCNYYLDNAREESQKNGITFVEQIQKDIGKISNLGNHLAHILTSNSENIDKKGLFDLIGDLEYNDNDQRNLKTALLSTLRQIDPDRSIIRSLVKSKQVNVRDLLTSDRFSARQIENCESMFNLLSNNPKIIGTSFNNTDDLMKGFPLIKEDDTAWEFFAKYPDELMPFLNNRNGSEYYRLIITPSIIRNQNKLLSKMLSDSKPSPTKYTEQFTPFKQIPFFIRWDDESVQMALGEQLSRYSPSELNSIKFVSDENSLPVDIYKCLELYNNAIHPKEEKPKKWDWIKRLLQSSPKTDYPA